MTEGNPQMSSFHTPPFLDLLDRTHQVPVLDPTA